MWHRGSPHIQPSDDRGSPKFREWRVPNSKISDVGHPVARHCDFRLPTHRRRVESNVLRRWRPGYRTRRPTPWKRFPRTGIRASRRKLLCDAVRFVHDAAGQVRISPHPIAELGADRRVAKRLRSLGRSTDSPPPYDLGTSQPLGDAGALPPTEVVGCLEPPDRSLHGCALSEFRRFRRP